MIDTKEIFVNYIRSEKLGSVYSGDSELTRRIYSEFNDSVQVQLLHTPSLPIPNLYITTKSVEFSVFTFKDQGQYFIGLGIGTIDALFRFFQFLYSQPYFDPHFGDSTKEKETPLDLSLNPDYLIDYFYNYDLDITPKCIVRKYAAYQTFYKAINYLLLHEYTHITHGHLDYLSKGKLNYLYYEKETVNKGNANIEKALEYDADSGATNHSFEDNTALLIFGDLAVNEQSYKINIKYLNIAVYFLNKLTELTGINFEDYAHRSHPIADQRTNMHWSLTHTYFSANKDLFDFDVNSLLEYSDKTFLEVSIPSYAKMFNKKIIDDKLIFFSSKQGLPYKNSIRQNWNIVRDKLEKLAFVNIAPVDKMLSGENSFDYDKVLAEKRGRDVDSGGEI